MPDETPTASEPVKHIPIADFRAQGYLQEVNRRVLHPLGLALEVTVMDRESDDTKLVERIAPLVADALAQRAERHGEGAVTTGNPDDVRAEIAREVAKVIVSDFWPRGSEHISGVWDYRDDPEGIYFGAGELDPNKADRVETILQHKLRRREEILGFGVQGVTDVARSERSEP